ncbi:unnamed protein product [Moneuplotes crassus]|uniref:Uncharacterized protein n=1 Tax=Euplotes crassus TaxID=5936 RepID=A0AAD1XML2_EUPCR|nr:unnamed protein product [Moneuplotes crassus]
MVNSKNPLYRMLRKIARLLQAVDGFGKTVTMSHQDKLKFKTVCGGLMTILATVFVSAFAYFMSMEPSEMKNIISTNAYKNSTIDADWITSIETVVTSEFTDYSDSEDAKIHNLTSNGFGISLDPNLIPNSEYGKFTANTRVRKNGGSAVTSSVTLKNCTQALFPDKDWDSALHYGLKYDLCLNTDELNLQANLEADNYEAIQLYYYKCLSSDTCVSSSDSSTYHRYKDMTPYALNSFYNSSDLSDPIKQYIKQLDPVELGYMSYVSYYIEVRENEVIFLNGTTQTFYDAYSAYDYKFPFHNFAPSTTAKITVMMSNEKRTYKQVERIVPNLSNFRNLDSSEVSLSTAGQTIESNSTTKTEEKINKDLPYKIMTILSQTGGFCYLVNLIFGTLISPFVNNMKLASMINSIKSRRQRTKEKSYQNPLQKNSPHEENKQNNTSPFKRIHQQIDPTINDSSANLNLHDPNDLNLQYSTPKNPSTNFPKKVSSKKRFRTYGLCDVLVSTVNPLKCVKKLRICKNFEHDKQVLMEEICVARICEDLKNLSRVKGRILKDIQGLKEAVQEISRRVEGDDRSGRQENDGSQVDESPENSVFKNLNEDQVSAFTRPISSHKHQSPSVHQEAITSIHKIVNHELSASQPHLVHGQTSKSMKGKNKQPSTQWESLKEEIKEAVKKL